MNQYKNIKVKYISDLKLLINKKLPDDWIIINSSQNAWVAKNIKENLYFKLFLKRNRLENIKTIFLGSRAKRFVKSCYKLLTNGFLAPNPIIWSSEIFAILKGESWVITNAIEGQGVFDFWCNKMAYESIHQKKKFLTELAKVIAELHNRGFIHGDLRLNNILVKETCDLWSFSFIDNEKNKFISKNSKRLFKLRCKNLVQMNKAIHNSIRDKDRLTFFIAYSRFSNLNKHKRKELLYKIISLTNKWKQKKYYKL